MRFAARDGGADGQVRQVELDRERVVLRRAVRGIRDEGRRAGREFRGVSCASLPPRGRRAGGIAVMLEHRDAACRCRCSSRADGDDVMAIWQSWARVLGLPLLVVDDDGALREPFQRLGRLDVGTPVAAPPPPRRDQWRRPSILMRRKPGRPPSRRRSIAASARSSRATEPA